MLYVLICSRMCVFVFYKLVTLYNKVPLVNIGLCVNIIC